MFKNILLVDDSEIARMVIKKCLGIALKNKFEIVEASNGVSALEKLKKNKIDLVLSDLNMPEMDGQQLLKRIKSSPKLNPIPVVIITSIANSANESTLYNNGADFVLGKPISPMKLKEIIESLYEKTGKVNDYNK